MALRNPPPPGAPPSEEDDATVVEPRRQNGPKRSAKDRYEDSVSPASFTPEPSLVPTTSTTKEQLLAQFEAALKMAEAQSKRGPFAKARALLLKEWFPLLKFTLLRAGGDGLEARLNQMVRPPGRSARTTLLSELSIAMQALALARDAKNLFAQARRVTLVVSVGLSKAPLEPLTLRFVEEELENRISLDTLLKLFFSTSPQLKEQRAQITTSINSIRGVQQEGSAISSADAFGKAFLTLKIERGLVDAELRWREALGIGL